MSVTNLAEPDSDDATFVDEESAVSDHHTTKQPQHCFHVSNWLANILGLSRVKSPLIESNNIHKEPKISVDLMDGSPSPPLVQRLTVMDPSVLNGTNAIEISPRERTQSQPIPITGPSKQLRSLSFEQAISSSSPILIKPRKSNNAGESDHEDVPPSYVDERDGHIWRAKYCVLENGVLYFYRNAKIGNSLAAQNERDRKPRINQNGSANDQMDATFTECHEALCVYTQRMIVMSQIKLTHCCPRKKKTEAEAFALILMYIGRSVLHWIWLDRCAHRQCLETLLLNCLH
jgi:hypothetical protein